MEEALSRLLDMIENSDSDEDDLDDLRPEDDPDTATLKIIADIAKLDVPDIAVNGPKINVYEYDKDSNILDPIIREEFKHEVIFDETELFTAPISTTNTMEGFMSNVHFHERDLTNELLPDECVVLCRSNYGKVIYDKYSEPVKIRKTNRGRKKRPKQKKPRKKQGQGTDFNSQITFVSAPASAVLPDDSVPPDAKVYKFKVFRTGRLQLPGARQDSIDDVVYCAKRIADMLNVFLHPFEPDPAKLTNVVNINPVMKNYKFMLKLLPKQLIDLDLLKIVLAKEHLLQLTTPQESTAPKIYKIKYDSQETKLSITFDTPIKNKPFKKTRINIFVRGKINVLGAFDVKATRKIIDYLHDVFLNTADIIADEYVVPPIPDWEQSIADTDEIGCGHEIELPVVSDDEYDCIMNCASEIYNDYIAESFKFLEMMVLGQ